MKRIIKFRVWDKENQKMEYPPSIESGNLGEWYCNIFDNPDCYDLMQFTGLFSENNEEIYEGDIMEIWDSTYGKRKYLEVKWNLNKAEWEGCWGRELVGNIYENLDLKT